MDQKNIQINKRLFVTATPKIYKKIGQETESVLSMDNKKWYGKEFFKYSLRQGINDKYLCDYQILTLFTKESTIENFLEDNQLVGLAKENYTSQYIASAIMIINGFKEHGNNFRRNNNSNYKVLIFFCK